MGVRDYAPVLGRFISRDPAGFAGGSNLYAYCTGDPVNFYDPDGQMPHVVAMALIGAATNGAAECFAAYMSGARGMDLVKAFGRGALKGAISGAAIGLLGPAAGACSSLGMAMGIGGAEAAVQNILAQLMNVIGGGQDNFNWKSFFQDSLMGAVTGGMGKALGFLCFDGETAVNIPAKATRVAANRNAGMVAGVTVPIKTIKAGDKVFARDEKTGKTVIAKVKEVFERTSDHLITVELASSKNGKTVEVLKTTRQHPFFVDGKGWLPAGGLAIGNSIVTRAGPRLFVKSVKWLRRAQGYTVYNFEVESESDTKKGGADTHSYFVGSAGGGAWVHNGQYNIHLHHIFPQQFRDRFRQIMGPHFDVDDFTIALPDKVHLDGAHGWPKTTSSGFTGWGAPGATVPGGYWNQQWRDFFANNPNVTPTSVRRQAVTMLRDFGYHKIRIVKYNK